MRRVFTLSIALALMLAMAPHAFAAIGTDALVTVGSPVSPFSENKQNEPALAVDRLAPLLRQPHIELRRDSVRGSLQGLRGDRRLAHRQRSGRGRERQGGVAAARRRFEAIVDDLLGQGADLGGQRLEQSVLR